MKNNPHYHFSVEQDTCQLCAGSFETCYTLAIIWSISHGTGASLVNKDSTAVRTCYVKSNSPQDLLIKAHLVN